MEKERVYDFWNMGSKDISRIQFHYLVKPFTFRNRIPLKRFLFSVLKKGGRRPSHINFIFCSDPYLLEINQMHLQHDFYTDIITFELSTKGEDLLADIFISIDRVKENARVLNHPFTHELHRVIFHGALHLCGFGDKSKAEQLVMRQREDELLARYFRSTWNSTRQKP